MEPKMSCATSNRIMFRRRVHGGAPTQAMPTLCRGDRKLYQSRQGRLLGDVFDAQKPYSYGHLSVISTYNPIYRMYNPIYNQL
jgi:hypothetical protein